MVPQRGIEPVLLSLAAGGIGTPLPTLVTSRPYLPAASDTDKEASLAHPCHHRTDE